MANNINDFETYIQNLKEIAAPRRTIRNFLRKIKRFPIKYKLKKIIKHNKNKKIIVHMAVLSYDAIMKQRPQQIADALSKKNDVLYFYVFHDYDLNYVRKINQNLYFITDYQLIKQALPKHFVHLYANGETFDKYEVQEAIINGHEIIYEYIDALHDDLFEVDDWIIERHNFIVKDTNIPVVCTARSLYNEIVKKRQSDENVLLTSNGVKYEDFQLKATETMPKKLEKIYKKTKKYVLYYGAIGPWFDYELIKKIADNNNYEILLLGMKYGEVDDKMKELKKYKNIHYFGPVQYEELKKYGFYSDVLIIPFIINEITEATSPVKIFEYMAMERPIVITDLPECRNFESVLIGKTHNEFIKNVSKALKLKNNPKQNEILKREALENTWEAKAEIIYEITK